MARRGGSPLAASGGGEGKGEDDAREGAFGEGGVEGCGWDVGGVVRRWEPPTAGHGSRGRGEGEDNTE